QDRTHFLQSSRLEGEVADAEHLVDDQNIGLHVRRDGKAEAREHPGGVAFHRSVDELVKSRELYDLVELAADFGARHAENCAVQIDVVSARQVQVEASADFDQRRETAVHLDVPTRGPHYAAQVLEHRALACAVVADDADGFALLDLE